MKFQARSFLFQAVLFTIAAVLSFANVQAGYNPQRIGFSYSYPTNYSDWANAYLAGNGKMGIMVFGNPLNETIIYNDRGFNLAASTNSPVRSFAQVSASDLATIKSNCAAGNFAAANQLAVSSAHYQGGGEGSRHPGYDMLISIPEDGAVSNYSRTCNFRTGEIIVKWTDHRGNWERRAFVSRKDNVIVQYLTAPSGGTLNCSIQLSTDPGMNFWMAPWMTFSNISDVNFLNLRARYPANTGSAGYEGVTRVVTSGGAKTMNGTVLNISNATSVILLTRTAKYYSDCANQWDQQLLQNQLAAISTDYDTLLHGQIATHGAIYDRVTLDLNASAQDRARSNEELLNMQKKSSVPVKALWERVFDAGRYYYLSSSSDQSPPDLLGIWTGDCNAGWGGFYHLDVNANIQVAQGNIGDMPEAMEGYFSINERWRADHTTNARKLLGCRGMVACGNTPGMAPGAALMAGISDFYPYQYATGEEPWLLYPFWEHYLVTGDTNFLRNRLYPLLKDMGHFYEDFLTLTDTNGHYIFAGSVSPENQPSNVHVSLLNNSSFDISGAKFALTALIQTCNILGLDQGAGQGVETWSNILNKLPPYLINSDGALQEWSWPGLDDNYGHRHLSHLLPVWRYREITPESTPVLFKAATVALAKRDAFHEPSGHGVVHGALIATCLNNAQSVNKRLLQLTREGYYYNSLCSSHNDKHGTFCTDTCNALPAIMMEMLVSSSPGILELLPALPQSLNQGTISGVKGRNRVTVQNLSWDMDNKSVNCTLKSDIDQAITLIERNGIDTITTSATVSASPLGQIARVIQLPAGVSTSITIGLSHVSQPPVNLALNQPVTVSSVAYDCPGPNAVDGDEGSRWSSASTDNEWIYVDLGSIRNLTGVHVNWEAAYAKSYKIQVSNNTADWTDVYSTTNGHGGIDQISFAASGRYVRMLGVQRATVYGYSLWEFEVYGATPTSGTGSLIDDTDPLINYDANWWPNGPRGQGDYGDAIHYSPIVGAVASYTFNGTGIDYIASTGNEGNVDVYLDNTFQTNVNLSNPTARAQQAVYHATGLALGNHTIKIINKSPAPGVIDAFRIYGGPPVLKVACIGDSITAGAGASANHSYPSQLARMLGPAYTLSNFGVSGTTMLKSGDNSYWNTPAFTNSANWLPDIVVIALGANDSKPQNWTNKDRFLGDCEAMIAHYQTLASQPTVYVNTCASVQNPGAFGITDAVVTGEIVPLLKQAALAMGCKVIDVNAATQNLPATDYLDTVHPTDPGAKVIAQTVYANLTGLSTPPPSPPPVAVATVPNLALNRPVFASSTADNYPASNAVDGDAGSRWSSAATDNEWIYIDLGSVRNLTGVKLNWEAAYATAYQIQVSDDAVNWTDVYSTTNGRGGIEQISLAASGRFARMLGRQRATIYGYSLWEFEVYGVGQVPATRYPATLDASAAKIACIGDSITAGSQNYPSYLGRMLGYSYTVENFGVNSTTVLKKGDFPYWKTQQYIDSGNSSPDIVIIMLGSNDSKPQNWTNRNEFVTDYKALIHHYQSLPSHPKVYLNTCPSVYNNGAFGITDRIATGEVAPLVKEIGLATGCVVFDVNAATRNMPQNFPDNVHPNATGAQLIAQTVFDGLVKEGVKPGAAIEAPNLALRKPVTVSSVADNCPAANAVDGDLATRWSSGHTDNEWICVDLEAVTHITGVYLKWETAYGKAYKLQVSDDAVNWTDVYATTNGSGGTEHIKFTADGRYVRMLGRQRGTIYGYSLWEFKVEGNITAPSTRASLGQPSTP